MKKLIVLIFTLLFCIMFNTSLYAETIVGPPDSALKSESEDVRETETKFPNKSYCPVRNIVSDDITDCLRCHTTPNWKIKEADIAEGMELPFSVGYFEVDGVKYFKFYISEITIGITNTQATSFEEFYRYALKHPEVKHVILELHSPGGSLLDTWRIVGYMDEMKEMGYIVETRCYGFAASAAFLLFSSGSHGYRLASEQAEFMWHELMVGEFFSIKTPSKTRDEADILRHLQDTINERLAKVSNMTKKEIDDAIRKKELWLNGKDMVEKGFADGLIADRIKNN